MPEIWVVNASPVIVLARVDQLHLLKDLSDELLLPEAVLAEVLAGPESDPARLALAAGWATGQAPAAIRNEVLEWGLGAGETAVIALAMDRPGSTAVLDDSAARACAKTFGVPILGTLGVVLRAKKRGLISSAADVLRSVRSAGLYLDEQVIRLALGRIGESW